MNGKAKFNPDIHPFKPHECNRHKDLTILMHNAKKRICNTCFATLKKSYFNVIAGLLLEASYLHTLTDGLVIQMQASGKLIKIQEQAILKLIADIADHQNNGRHHEPPTPKPPNQAVPGPAEIAAPGPPPDTKENDSKGHVAQATASLSNLLHDKVKRVLKKLRAAHEAHKF